ncbi:hypothetical protein DPEC_G00257250 [Dallia pectoralis]|uniref:Uncharacterized protein n=1 Tax=Dallia pectoralis TaxID=75939 RepID=A0ACC2FQR4_DALPE|nr:hypothetical protein DPEC_G00257250 [Dallia pectoralis]
MCWFPIDETLPLPGDPTICARGPSLCAGVQSLAARLRRIGDEMDKNWTKGTPVGGDLFNPTDGAPAFIRTVKILYGEKDASQ